MTIAPLDAAERPVVEELVRRLAETPADFLLDPAMGETGTIAVAAVVSDVLVAAGGAELGPDQAARFVVPDEPVARNWLRCVAVAAWLLDDPALRGADRAAARWAFLSSGLDELSRLVAADALVADPDRREELARRCIHALGLLPAGETRAQATDRLAALDTAERARVVEATRAAEQRAAEVRAAMHAQAAAEAAAKVSRE